MLIKYKTNIKLSIFLNKNILYQNVPIFLNKNHKYI